jgi:hypothetical protein
VAGQSRVGCRLNCQAVDHEWLTQQRYLLSIHHRTKGKIGCSIEEFRKRMTLSWATQSSDGRCRLILKALGVAGTAGATDAGKRAISALLDLLARKFKGRRNVEVARQEIADRD